MILPRNYEECYTCINERGSTSKIYVNADWTKVYKIYKGSFKYDEEKFKEFLTFCNPNCLSPLGVVSIENKPEIYVGYEMNYDCGVPLSDLTDQSLEKIITASLRISETLGEISGHHFLIVDPSVNNITFFYDFKFVDAYSFLLAKKIAADIIYKRNMKKVNDSVLCGLIDFSYKIILSDYLNKINSKYIGLFEKTLINGESDVYIYDMLSIVREVTGEDELSLARRKILNFIKK